MNRIRILHRLAKAGTVCAITLAVGASLTAATPAHSRPASAKGHHSRHVVEATAESLNMLVTLYGWNDNSPPGCETYYGTCAGGAGTYSSPTTFATDAAELPVGTLVYVAPLDRYFVMGDDCVNCDEDWTGKGPDGGPSYRHIDLWAGGTAGDNATDLYNCESNWTSNGQAPVIVNPASGEPVANSGAGGPVFVASSEHCWVASDNGGPSSSGGSSGSGGAYPAGFQQLVDSHSGDCLDIDGGSTANLANLDIWPCKTSAQANQEFEFSSVSGGYGELINSNSNKSLTVSGSSTAGGALVVQSTTNGAASSLWLPVSLGSGEWQFKNKDSGLCLDVDGDKTTEGTDVDQWACKTGTGTNQAFSIK